MNHAVCNQNKIDLPDKLTSPSHPSSNNPLLPNNKSPILSQFTLIELIAQSHTHPHHNLNKKRNTHPQQHFHYFDCCFHWTVKKK